MEMITSLHDEQKIFLSLQNSKVLSFELTIQDLICNEFFQ